MIAINKTVRLRLTVVYEYEANPLHYDTYDPETMALMDKKNYDNDPTLVHETLLGERLKVKVEPV